MRIVTQIRLSGHTYVRARRISCRGAKISRAVLLIMGFLFASNTISITENVSFLRVDKSLMRFSLEHTYLRIEAIQWRSWIFVHRRRTMWQYARARAFDCLCPQWKWRNNRTKLLSTFSEDNVIKYPWNTNSLFIRSQRKEKLRPQKLKLEENQTMHRLSGALNILYLSHCMNWLALWHLIFRDTRYFDTFR